jgi:hypothetical protein
MLPPPRCCVYSSQELGYTLRNISSSRRDLIRFLRAPNHYRCLETYGTCPQREYGSPTQRGGSNMVSLIFLSPPTAVLR